MLMNNLFFLSRLLCFSLIYMAFSLSASAAVNVVSGNNQTLGVSIASENIVFKVVNAAGNPTTGVTLNFVAKNAGGSIIANGMIPASAVVESTGANAGQASSRFNGFSIPGVYSITASVAGSPTEAGTATLTVIAGAPGNLVVTSGNSQTVRAGNISEPIIFTLTDAAGNAIANRTVNFAVNGPAGAAPSVTPVSATTGVSGQAITQLSATGTVGNYSVTAILVGDTSKTAVANAVVIAGEVVAMNTERNAVQTTRPGKTSGEISFKVVDSFGNPVSSQPISFLVRLPDGSETSAGLNPVSALTNVNGTVNVVLTSTTTQGSYLIKASTQNSLGTRIFGNASVNVSDGQSGLPSLALGGGVDASGTAITTDATFSGGISVNGSSFQQERTLKLSDSVVITGSITTDKSHVGQIVDIVVAAGYRALNTSVNTPSAFFMLDTSSQIRTWDLNIASLRPFKSQVTLGAQQTFRLFEGQFIATGNLNIYFGYRLSSGAVIFNAQQTINITINP